MTDAANQSPGAVVPGDGDSADGGPFSWLSGISRRAFLRRSSLTAAVGAAGALPVLSGILSTGASEAPAAETTAGEAGAELGEISEPVIAQIRSLDTGEISVFSGEREVVLRDPALARQLFSAVRK
jgi:hypothetical protein